MTMDFEYVADATPIHDHSGLKLTWVQTQSDLNRVEAKIAQRAREESQILSPFRYKHLTE